MRHLLDRIEDFLEEEEMKTRIVDLFAPQRNSVNSTSYNGSLTNPTDGIYVTEDPIKQFNLYTEALENLMFVIGGKDKDSTMPYIQSHVCTIRKNYFDSKNTLEQFFNVSSEDDFFGTISRRRVEELLFPTFDFMFYTEL